MIPLHCMRNYALSCTKQSCLVVVTHWTGQHSKHSSILRLNMISRVWVWLFLLILSLSMSRGAAKSKKKRECKSKLPPQPMPLSKNYPEGDVKAAREAALKRHNLYRKWHKGASLLSLDEKLTESAQKFAEKLVTEIGCRRHSDDRENVGENLNGSPGYPPNGKKFNFLKWAEKSVDFWYFEICHRDFNKWPDMSVDVDHFTQVIWNDSVKLGVGIAASQDNSAIYVVAQYGPRGNVVSESRLKKNLPPLICPGDAICYGKEPRYGDVKAEYCTESTQSPPKGPKPYRCGSTKDGTGKPLNPGELSNDMKKSDFNAAKDAFLERHNMFRKWHKDTPPLKLDDKLNTQAQNFAEKLVTEIGCKVHSELGPDREDSGENVYRFKDESGKPFNLTRKGARAVNKWYYEICGQNNSNSSINPYAQVVWKSATKVGLGMAANINNSELYVVAHYNEPVDKEAVDKNVKSLVCAKKDICKGDKAKDEDAKGDACKGDGEDKEKKEKREDLTLGTFWKMFFTK